MGTPGIEEGGKRRDSKDTVRNVWRKLVESEERLKFWKRMVGLGLGVREVEHLGEDLKQKFRSEEMRGGRRDRDVIELVIRLKLRDERKHQRELRLWRDKVRGELETE